MNPTNKQIAAFKQKVIESSENPDFIHHSWFVKYHLEIVDKIAKELQTYYPEANPQIIEVLVWLHDFGKTIDFANQYELTLSEGRKALETTGFPAPFIETVLEYLSILDKKLELDIHKSPIEVQIVSSADGCSHFVGPFMSLWWLENANKPFQELMEDNRKKLLKDWTRKIVLPEARDAFTSRFDILLEQSGHLPEQYLR